MTNTFSNFVKALKKFFIPFPHLSHSTIKLFIPILPWYLFLRGLIKIIQGLRSISGSFQFGSLPKMFSTLIDINPFYLFWDGILNVLVGVLYFNAFTALSQKNNKKIGWISWFQASALLAAVRFYEVIFHQSSVFWTVIFTIIGWYGIFEFERFFSASSTKKNIEKEKKPKKNKPIAKS